MKKTGDSPIKLDFNITSEDQSLFVLTVPQNEQEPWSFSFKYATVDSLVSSANCVGHFCYDPTASDSVGGFGAVADGLTEEDLFKFDASLFWKQIMIWSSVLTVAFFLALIYFCTKPSYRQT